MDIRPIRTEADYDWALAEVEKYFDVEPPRGTPEADRFEVLTSLIEAYEAKAWPIEAADPIETIVAVMAARGLRQADFAGMIGSRSRASEVINRKRPLTVDMIHKLSTAWQIPADVLVRPYRLGGRAEKMERSA